MIKSESRPRDDAVDAAKAAGLRYSNLASPGITRKKSGKAFVYRAKVERSVIEQARATDVVTKMLGDEPRPAMAALVSAVEAVDPELLDELERLVAARRRSGRGS